ncbi:MAG: LacI family DNA-binding transcriptional regulator [Lentisphaeria bacterium]|nr:LacI family DNA-binding transcriptional regulator [Lentisphaeria bacterium]
MRESKSVGVVQFLIGELEKLPPGGKLPSTVEIQKSCGVSQAVVTRAIDKLKKMNLIEVRPQRGYFKQKKQRSNVCIVFLRRNDESVEKLFTFYYNNLSRILTMLTFHGYGVNFHRVEALSELPFYPSRSEGICSNDIIVTFSMPRSQMEEVEHMKRCGFRFIHWLPDFAPPCENCITIDDCELVRTQVEFLVRQGHRRIGFIHGVQPGRWTRPDNMRFDAFCRLNIEFQLQVLPEYLCFLRYNLHSPEEYGRKLRTMFSGELPPTALIITDDEAKMVYDALESMKLAPGRDVAILGTDNANWDNFMTPRLSSVGFDIEFGVRKMIEMIEGLQEGRTYPPACFPILLKERESTPPR